MIRISLVRAGAVVAAGVLAAGVTTAPAAAATAGAPLVVSAVDAATGAPVSDFCATAAGGNACTAGSEVTLTGLPAGTTTVTVTPARTSDHLPAGPLTVTLPEDGTAAVTAPLTLGGRLATTILDRSTGAPVRLACLVLVEPAAGGLSEEGRGE